MKIFVNLFFLIFGLSLCNAQDVIDQQNNSSVLSYLPLFAGEYAQGFTASQNKKLSKIEVLMDCGSSYGCLGQKYDLKLYNANANFSPTGAPLFAQQGTGFNGADGNPVWQTFTVTNGPLLVSGGLYSIFITDNGSFSDFGIIQSTNSSYPNGVALGRSNPTSPWYSYNIQDFIFKIWVNNNSLGTDEINYQNKPVIITYSKENLQLLATSLEDTPIEIYSSNGIFISKYLIKARINNFIDVKKWQKGVYFIQYQKNNKKIGEKILIQ